MDLKNLIENEKKNTSGVKYISIDERWSNFDFENISEVERNIKQYTPAVQKKIYETLEKSGW